MGHDGRGIDHIVLTVGDLEAARHRFRALGFTTTPPARHPFGTGNSLIQLDGNFVEILAVVDPAKVPPPAEGVFNFGDFNRRFLESREGLSMLVLSSEDAEADQAAWRDKGLETFDPLYFSRKATLPDGTEATVAFTVAFLLDGRLPGVGFFVCQQHAPEAFWQPKYQSHGNGAVQIVGVTLAADEPARHETFFADFAGTGGATTNSGQLRVETPRGVIELISREQVARRFASLSGPLKADGPHFVAATISVANLGGAADRLRAGETPFAETERGLEVAPDQAFGMVLELVPASP